MMTPGELVELRRRRGGIRYEGQDITQLEHAWQCGQLAKRSGATPSLQLAAWLHDLGHLMTDLPGSPSLHAMDDRHEHAGAAVLRPLFGEAVAAPVALHVDAKRYLVTVRPLYFKRLSADSLRSLALQGGVMSDDELARFIARPFAQDAIRLRTWDEASKITDWRPQGEALALPELEKLMDDALG